MPKRLIDGEGVWRSDKLRIIEPVNYRAEYTNLLPLALANGTFECDPHRIWSLVYAYNRPDVSPEEVSKILDALERAKMLFRWIDPKSGKVCGYWAGIEKEGRLPTAKRMEKKHYVIGPTLPQPEYDQWLANGQPVASLAVAFAVASAVAVASAPASAPASAIGLEETPPSQAIPLPPRGKGGKPVSKPTAAATEEDPFEQFDDPPAGSLGSAQGDGTVEKDPANSICPDMDTCEWMELAARKVGRWCFREPGKNNGPIPQMREVIRHNEETLGLQVFRNAYLDFIKSPDAEDCRSPSARFTHRLSEKFRGVRIMTIMDTLRSCSKKESV
jgi:hypothetical protein